MMTSIFFTKIDLNKSAIKIDKLHINLKFIFIMFFVLFLTACKTKTVSPPSISGISPTFGTSEGGNTVTISGSGFSGASVVIGNKACPVTSSTGSQITCRAPANSSGVYSLTVTNSNRQTISSSSAYTYNPPVTVTSVSPSSGIITGGTTVTITGTGFLTGAIADLGSSTCSSLTVVSSTSITCVTASHAAGVVNANVTNLNGQLGTLASAYIYRGAPTVTSVTANAGALAGGTLVTITGTGFYTGSIATFGGVACTGLTVLSSTSMTCTTPTRTAGAVTVTVTNADLQTGSTVAAYTYQPAPTVTGIFPLTGFAVGGTSVTITGNDFVTGATVSFGGSTCTGITVVSSTSIQCTTSAHTAGVVTATVTNADSQAGSQTSAFTYVAAPTVTNVAGSAGALAGGTSVTITGTGFVAGATVDFGGSACAAITVASTTSITCTTSAHGAGAVTVTVTNTDTQSGSMPIAFTYQAAPTVTSVSFNAGALGGGSIVTITGTGFVTGATVDFGGSACNGITVVSGTSITCTTSAHAAGAVTVTVINADLQTGNAATAFTYRAAPTVTSVASPTGFAVGGTSVTISGTGFISGATVDFGGSPCAGVSVMSTTSITCTTTAHAEGPVSVTVTNADSQIGNAAAAFTYQAAPTVTSVASPTGFAVGGTSVTISGTGFVAGATVDFGGSPCAGVSVMSTTSITCTTTAHAEGPVSVTVTNADSQTGNAAAAFTYQAAPTVTSVASPTGFAVGGTTVTVTGTGFVAGAIVDFGGSACTGVSVVSATSITCTTPAHAAGVVTVAVTNADTQTGNQASAFTYVAAPTISSISPSAGALGGGTIVTITGTDFVSGATIDFGGSACTGITVTSTTSITCTTSAHAAGFVTTSVTNADTQTGNLASAFTYQAAPTVTGVTSSTGFAVGGTSVTVAGTGFVAGAIVDFGGSVCTSVTVVGSTSITCTTASHAAGTVTVTVTNVDTQTGNLASAFTYQAAPTVSSLSPNAGALGGGTNVTITGTGFISGATVSVGGAACTSVLVTGPTTIDCTTPLSITTGAVDVVVTNSDTQTGTLVSGYTYNISPTVTGVSPSEGVIAGATAVTITGTGFYAGATVDFGGSACASITVFSATSITCTTAAHAAGAVTVSVTNADTQSGNLASAFTYRAAPTVTSVSANAGALAGGASVTITGTGFYTGATVDFDVSACTSVTVVSATSITCTTPAHAAGAVTVTVTNADTQTGNAATAFTYQAAPTVSSLSPNAGALGGGTNVTITGTGFISGATVSVGGAACTSVLVTGPTTIDCTTPLSITTGAVDVVVTNSDTQTGTLVSGYTYNISPTVTGVFPSEGVIAGATAVTITGTGFYAGATVDFGGSACASITVFGATSITCTTAAHAAGAVTVTVTNADTQSGNLASAFTYRAAPTVTSVSANAGALAGGTSVTITGTGFYTGATVDFDVSACTSVTVVSATSITCTTPAHAAGAVTVTVTNADTQTGNAATAFTYQAAPTVSNVSPSVGPLSGGATITITGTEFLTGATVTVGGAVCTLPIVVNPTTIQCTTPAHASGGVTVIVTNADSQSGSLVAGYIYLPSPTVSSVAPIAGALAGGTSVTITGSGFLAGATVDVGGSACTGVTVVSGTSITCTTPAHAAGAITITVTNTDGQLGSMASAYTYQVAPTVTSVSPLTGFAVGGNSVTITGTGFVTGAVVDFGGSTCSSVTVVSATSITCTTSPHSAGVVTATVTNADTQSGNAAAAFTYQIAPTVTSLSPNTGPLAGGTSVTITGTGFLSGATVDLGGAACTGITVVNSTSITCTTPAHASGSVLVVVTNTDTQSGGALAAFSFVPAPTVTSVSSNAGALAGGTNVTISGTAFLAGATVDFGGSACTGVTVVSSTSITCTTAAHAAGAVTVTVTNTDAQSGNATTAYTYKAAPTVTSVAATSGALSGGTLVTITGTGFYTGAIVDFGGAACTSVTVVSATSITCTTPAHAAGAVTVTVTNADTQTGNAATAFTYQAAPTVTSVSPLEGLTSGGTAVTITGTEFLAGATVSVGGSACTGITVVSATSITCTTPAHASGAVTVSVTNTDAQLGSATNAYTYRGAPTVTSVSPSTGALVGSTAITVTGTGFYAGAVVDLGGSTCSSVTVVSSTSITCITSAHAAGAVTVTVVNVDTQLGTLPTGYTYQTTAILSWQTGAISPNPPNPDSYGSTAVNVTHTYTLTNIGDTSSAITVSKSGGTPGAWLFGTDNCSGTTLAFGATCTVQVTFLGQFLSTGSYTTSLEAVAATGGTTLNTMNASVP